MVEDLEVGITVSKESVDVVMVAFELRGAFEQGFYPEEEGCGVVVPKTQWSLVQGVIVRW